MPFSPGKIINDRDHGRIEIVDLLAENEYADSYKARISGETYFLKKYKDPSVLFTKWFNKYYEYQNKIISKMRNRNVDLHVVTVHGAFINDSDYYQLHEWNDGQDLKDYMDQIDAGDKKHSKEIIRIATRYLQGMKQVNSSGIIHADLKPQNILMRKESGEIIPVISDFDWSIIEGEAHPWEGGYRGTPFYLSYEHLHGYQLSPKSDVYTSSIILYELVTNCSPIKALLSSGGSYSPQELNEALKGPLNDPRKIPTPFDLNPQAPISKEANEMLHRCLHPDVDERPSYDELLSALSNSSKFLVLKLENGFEIRTRKEDIEAGKGYIGRERCRMLPNYKSISSLQVYTLPSKDYKKWYLVPLENETTNLLVYSSNDGNSTEITAGMKPIELHTGDVLRIVGRRDKSVKIAQFEVELRSD